MAVSSRLVQRTGWQDGYSAPWWGLKERACTMEEFSETREGSKDPHDHDSTEVIFEELAKFDQQSGKQSKPRELSSTLGNGTGQLTSRTRLDSPLNFPKPNIHISAHEREEEEVSMEELRGL
eukprot:CAMPEP_0195019834 /NCGR_PEP_ID=MMETSP0326_2-20130528/33757_1 /TAXON_ID=2866 ORGANISM="Crypthecodinium cohnii, Strain Seligo" /NCGR_SAMPLE_ID=MMETSP0326_2 /ASSEMBLY_ACC=CAM_ASM_000348 /LENGTH=121 /DNA_ID=CAMNT_0040038111 /DNA_START=184 /DNA_END=548 /DNA_ORIENTATION=+